MVEVIMTQETWTAVDRYIADQLLTPDAALKAALESSEAAGLPPINVSPPQGKMLMMLAQLHGARTVLEVGTLGATARSGWRGRCRPGGASSRWKSIRRTRASPSRTSLGRACPRWWRSS
jgi:hypothetical protein